MGSARHAFTLREARDRSTITGPPAHSWLGSVVKLRGLEVMRDLFQHKASAALPDGDDLLAFAVVQAINAFVIHDAGRDQNSAGAGQAAVCPGRGPG